MGRETLCGAGAETSTETFKTAHFFEDFQRLGVYESSQSERFEGKRCWIVAGVDVNNSGECVISISPVDRILLGRRCC